MNFTSTIKRAPKWAWFTAAGVGVGAAAIKLYKGRAVEDPNQAATDGTTAGVTGGTPVLTASPTSIISPPVVGVTQSDDGGSLLSLAGLYIGATQDVMDTLSNIYGPVAAIEQNWFENGFPTNPLAFTPDQIITLAGGGNSPQPVVQAPPPQASVPTPVAQPPVQSAPAPAPAPQPVPAATASGPQCGGEFPFVGPAGCYKVVCASGKGDHAKGRWHFYQNGSEQHVANTC